MWQYSICFMAAAIVVAVFDLDGIRSIVAQTWLALALMMAVFSAVMKYAGQHLPYKHARMGPQGFEP
ncbi:hypothetical protein [Zavarzinella formosa]|uniref:hypothetical protein n=1 Tax=Zavarzinella formosa TaxID=360055 RepID=UPI0012F9A429|nr:hypothetical protein [Zavarzinella formosa]